MGRLFIYLFIYLISKPKNKNKKTSSHAYFITRIIMTLNDCVKGCTMHVATILQATRFYPFVSNKF